MPTSPAAPGSNRPGVDPAIMAARYGGASGGRPVLALAVAAAVLLAVGALALQVVSLSRPGVNMENLGFTVHDPTRATVRFNVIAEPGSTVRCTLTALNEGFTEVGFREVVVGPVREEITSHQADVTTTELATTGSVTSCELVEEP
ncbi:DUF4307 domain-containing protein [Georgenia sp. AZ-5]|uniref:DUF4307 domain-containing protein n=1 Tax=Georgenia sp. AZ-5 TaxID=3367526 RepID=UPI00375402B8